MEFFFEGAIVKLKQEYAPQFNSEDEGGYGIIKKEGIRKDESFVQAMLDDEEKFKVTWGNGNTSYCFLSQLKLVHPHDVLFKLLKTKDNNLLLAKDNYEDIKLSIQMGLTLIQVSDEEYNEALTPIFRELQYRIPRENNPKLGLLHGMGVELCDQIQDYWNRV